MLQIQKYAQYKPHEDKIRRKAKAIRRKKQAVKSEASEEKT